MTRRLTGGLAGAGGGGGGVPLPLGGDLSGTTDAASVDIVGDASIVTSIAEFLASPAVSSAGPVHTVTGLVALSGTITFAAGDTVVSSETGFIVSRVWPSSTMVFDVDAAAMSGPLVMGNIRVVNNNIGASSFCVDWSSLLGRIVRLDTVSCLGIRGFRVANVLGPSDMSTCLSESPTNAIGVLYSGTMGPHANTRFNFLVGTSAQVGVELDDLLILTSVFAVQSMAAILQLPTQSAVAIDNLIVLQPGAVLTFSGCSHDGPQDRFFRQDPGDMPVDDLRIIPKGNPSTRDWTAGVSAGRLDTAAPLVIALPVAPSAPVPIPYSTGAGVEVEAPEPVRFELVKIAGAPFDWFVRYLGVIPDARAGVSWSILIERVGGGSSFITVCSERDRAIFVTSCQQDDGGVLTDFTEEAQSAAIDDVPLIPSPLAVGDITYFGSSPTLPTAAPVGPDTVEILISQSGVGTFTVVWEYFNGAIWTALIGLVDGTAGFTAAPGFHDLEHTRQGDMSTTTVNGVLAFYIRSRVTVATSLTTQPLATQVIAFTGFAVVPSTVQAIESRAEIQPVEKSGNETVNPRDRIRPAIQNQGAAHSVNVYDVSQGSRVFP